MAGTVCPHCQHQRTDADSGVPEWLCPGCGKKYYEAKQKQGLLERIHDAVLVAPQKPPKVLPCKACKKRVFQEASVCPHCGQPDPYHYVAVFQPYAKTGTAGRAIGFVSIGIVAAFTLFVLWAMQAPAKTHSKSEALVLCQHHIKGLLKAPSTADFVYDYRTVDRGDRLLISGSVDAQNGFGAMIRSRYGCTMSKSEKSWRVEDATLM